MFHGNFIQNEQKTQKHYASFLSLILSFSALVSSLNVILTMLFPERGINASFLYLLYAFFLVRFFLEGIWKIKLSSIYCLVIAAFAMGVTIMLFPQNMDYYWTTADDVMNNPIYVMLLYSVIGYFVARKITDVDGLIQIYEKYALVTVSLLVIRFLLGYFWQSVVPEYMTFSYNLVLPTLFFLLLSIREYKFYRLAFATVGSVLIVVNGCRGALLGLILSFMLYVLVWGKISTRRKAVLSLLTAIVSILIFVFYEQLFSLINDRLATVGLTSRTIEMALSSTLYTDSGRGKYQSRTWQGTEFLGKGLWGSRVVLRGHYPHNLFLELLCDFGYLLGGGLIFVLLYVLIHGLRKADEKLSVLLCALLSVGFIKLMFSGSYLNQEPALWVLIGLCLNAAAANSSRKPNGMIKLPAQGGATP